MTIRERVRRSLLRLDDYETNGDGHVPVLVVHRCGDDLLSIYRSFTPLSWSLGVEISLGVAETEHAHHTLAIVVMLGPVALGVHIG